MAAISFALAEQNRPIFSSFSWLLDDRRRRMAIFEGNFFSFKFVTLLQPAATHLFSILLAYYNLWTTVSTTSDTSRLYVNQEPIRRSLYLPHKPLELTLSGVDL